MTFADRYYHAPRRVPWWLRIFGYGKWTMDAWV